MIAELVTPEALLFSGDVKMVSAPGIEGDFGVLPLHSPLVSELRSDVVIIDDAKDHQHLFFISGGTAEVTQERCTILSQYAIDLDSITIDEAKRRAVEAEQNYQRAEDGPEKDRALRAKILAEGLVHCLETYF